MRLLRADCGPEAVRHGSRRIARQRSFERATRPVQRRLRNGVESRLTAAQHGCRSNFEELTAPTGRSQKFAKST